MSKVVFLDLEFTKSNPIGIIQIGALVADLSRFRIDAMFSKIANPGIEPCPFIEELTGITKQKVQQAPPIKQVLEEFADWMKDPRVPSRIYTWGEGDLVYLRRALDSYDVGPVKISGANAKEFYKLLRLCENKKQTMGLLRALKESELEFYGRQHDGLIDSFNLARLFFYLRGKLAVALTSKTKDPLQKYLNKDFQLCEEFRQRVGDELGYDLDFYF